MKSSLFFCNREDFIEVADLVLSNTVENDQKAISRLAHWKCCLPNVPAQVLCTHMLLVVKTHHAIEAERRKETFYITEEFENLAYASAVARSVSLLIEDNDDLFGLSTKAVASALGLPEWLTDVRNEIAHGRRLISLDFLKITADKILDWLRNCFWLDLLKKYSCFITSGGNGSPEWLQTEELLVMYEQQTYRSITIGQSNMKVIATRKRAQVVRQLGCIAQQDMSAFCQCFVRSGYMFPTIEQLNFLSANPDVVHLWSNGQSTPSSVPERLNKSINVAFLRTRKFWKMLIFHISNVVENGIPALIDAVSRSYPSNPNLYDRQIRLDCWIKYLVDKYISKNPSLGSEVMKRCSNEPNMMSLSVLRRLSFIDWPHRSDAIMCYNLIDLVSTYTSEYEPSGDEQVPAKRLKVYTIEDVDELLTSNCPSSSSQQQ